MSEGASIYALHDPTDVSGRLYVGKAADPARRLRAHFTEKGRTFKRAWLKSLVARGVRPEMVILEVVPPDGDWREAERFWIESLRALGLPLTNGNGGGHGSDPTPETREKMSAARRRWQHTPESIEKGAAKRRGRPLPAHVVEAAAKLRRQGLTPEQHARITDGRKRVKARGTTGLKGVFPTSNGRFVSRIVSEKRYRHLGIYGTAIEAAVAYDIAARRLWGARGTLNFPRPGELSARVGVEPQDWPDLPMVEVRSGDVGRHVYARTNATTGYRGVRRQPKGERFTAMLCGRYLGVFGTPEEAARAYDRAAVEKWGAKTILNFRSEVPRV